MTEYYFYSYSFLKLLIFLSYSIIIEKDAGDAKMFVPFFPGYEYDPELDTNLGLLVQFVERVHEYQ